MKKLLIATAASFLFATCAQAQEPPPPVKVVVILAYPNASLSQAQVDQMKARLAGIQATCDATSATADEATACVRRGVMDVNEQSGEKDVTFDDIKSFPPPL